MDSEKLNRDFIKVLEANKGLIYKVANSYCKDYEDRKDLVQEIIFQLWKSFKRYDPQYKLSTWMYRIALNVAISFYRKESKKSKIESDTPIGNLLYFEEEEDDTLNENLKLLKQFIAELRELDKALMLLYLEDKDQNEIAQILGLSVSNVSTKIYRIKKQLASKFDQKNIK